MHEVSHRQSIIKLCRLDLSGEAKQAAKVPNTSASLLLSFSPVSELLFELLYCKRTEMLYELFSGARGEFSKLEICNKNRTRQVSSNSER